MPTNFLAQLIAVAWQSVAVACWQSVAETCWQTVAACWPTAVAVCFAIAGLLVLGWERRNIWGTTLAAPWCWAVFAFLALAVAEAMIEWGLAGSLQTGSSQTGSSQTGAAIRFAAAGLTFCPLMSLLGAKRPQHRVWQWIVVSLWAVIVLPAAQTWVLDRPFRLHPAQSWFLMLLIALGAANFFGTKWWFCTTLTSAAQWILLQGELPGNIVMVRPPLQGAMGLGLACAALLLFAAAQRDRPFNGLRRFDRIGRIGRIRRTAVGKAPSQLDRLWLDFRDAFGVLWGLRVADRINAASAMYGWTLTLTWRGFRHTGSHAPVDLSELSPETADQVRQTVQNLLRRFVSPRWIASRLDQDLQ